MEEQQKSKNLLAPKPVHPRAIERHGLFGLTFVKQHNLIDEKWAVKDIIDEFYGVANLLSKRVVFEKLENKAHRRRLHRTTRNLRKECKNGRIKLQNILYGNNTRDIRNYLMGSKLMQRLYQKMPVNQVMENINQRTFVMRRERDRLVYRLEKLKQEYEQILMERSEVEMRIKYQNEFVLKEEFKSHQFADKIEKSKIRLKAYRSISLTYEKIIQVLRHDAVFYEPILRGLSKDIDDQAHFIKYVLHLGTPALEKFKKLNVDYRLLADKSRRSTHQKIRTVASFDRITPRPLFKSKTVDLVLNIGKHYARETKSMLQLKQQLKDIESTIKHIQAATLSSTAKEIFPRFQTQVQNNWKLIKGNEIALMQFEYVDFKEKLSNEKGYVLMHNFSEEEEKRLLRIKKLKTQIKAEDNFEEETLAFLKNRSDVFVVIRYFLWNLMDILRNVGRPKKLPPIEYSHSYLKLPLLKFEMQIMRACPPEVFETDTKEMLTTVDKKLHILMKEFQRLTKPKKSKQPEPTTDELWEEYHENFLAAQLNEVEMEEEIVGALKQQDDMFEESKLLHSVPNRKQIKLQSAKIVEELSKTDE